MSGKARVAGKKRVRKKGAAEPQRRRRVKEARPAVADDTSLHRLQDVAFIPGPAALLDQVLASAGGCTGLGARVEFAHEPDPAWVRGEVTRHVVAENEARDAQDDEDTRLRAEGECIPRRSTYYDGLDLRPEPEFEFHRVKQKWKPLPPRKDAAIVLDGDDGPPQVEGLDVFLTHQVIDSVDIVFETRGDFMEREAETRDFSHTLCVRFMAGSAATMLEVRYFLHEELVHLMQDGPHARREDHVLRVEKSKWLKTETWLGDVPYAFSARGFDDDEFSKSFHIKIPGDCDTVVDEGLLVLRQALRLHDFPDALERETRRGRRDFTRTQLYATDKFHGAVTSRAVLTKDVGHYRLRWLQFTPLDKAAWKADDAECMARFYD